MEEGANYKTTGAYSSFKNASVLSSPLKKIPLNLTFLYLRRTEQNLSTLPHHIPCLLVSCLFCLDPIIVEFELKTLQQHS